jgi:hypothetical protein
MKVIAIVKFNSGIALVLDESPKLIYQKQTGCILGSDGTFLQTYYLDRCGPGWEAFGGRKFDLIMEDGEVVHCHGQYWDGVKDAHRKMVEGEIIHVTACDINSLKDCYVFIGYKGVKHKVEELISRYKGIVYEYRDYEMLITKNTYRKPKKKLIPLLRKLRRQKRQHSFTNKSANHESKI